MDVNDSISFSVYHSFRYSINLMIALVLSIAWMLMIALVLSSSMGVKIALILSIA